MTAAGVNPFSSHYSGYGVLRDGGLVSVQTPATPLHAFHLSAHRQFVDFINARHCPCPGAASVVKTGQYAFCAYPDMCSSDVPEALCHDIVRFAEEFRVRELLYQPLRLVAFVAAFDAPALMAIEESLTACYTLLRDMHRIDSARGFCWTGRSNDIDSADFDFSIGGQRYVPIMLQPSAPNPDRQAPITVMVFNPRVVFLRLQERRLFDGMVQKIRVREKNPHMVGSPAFGGGSPFSLVANLLPEPDLKRMDRQIRDAVFGQCPFP